MASGTKYTVKKDLLDSVKAKVFKNTNFAVTATQTQKALCDMVESMWDDLVGGGANAISITYGDLLTAISGNTLITGTWYEFTFNNVHLVPNTLLANTETPGYSAIPETLMVMATSTSTLNGFALSKENKYDVVEYDVTTNTHGTNLVPDFGTIVKRVDAANNVSAHFDFRNFIVARYSLDKTSITHPGGVLDSGDVVYDTGDPRFKLSVTDGANVMNFRTVQDITDIDYPVYTTLPLTVMNTSITVDLTSISYSQAIIGASSKNISLGYGVFDIKIEDSYNVEIESYGARVTVLGSSNVKLGQVGIVAIRNCTKVTIGDCNNIMCDESDNVLIGDSSNVITLLDANNTVVGANVNKVTITNSEGNEVGVSSVSIMIIRESNFNVIAKACGAISLGNSVTNDFGSDCTDIEIYSGGHNRFAQGCNVINLLGEMDDAYTGTDDQQPGSPGVYYSPYSEMAYNTFGVGCSNISFNILGGRGNQFGDECKNLLFTKNDYTEEWRLVGTHWVRGIQNKTFECVIHGVSFLSPCQETVVVTPVDWYSQVIHNYQKNISDVWIFDVADEDVADTTNYVLQFTPKATTFPPLPTDTVGFTSGVGATKGSIIAGLKAALIAKVFAGPTGVFKTLGDRIHGTLDSYSIDTTTSNIVVMNQGMLSDLEGVHNMNYPGDRYGETPIKIGYNTQAVGGSSYFDQDIEDAGQFRLEEFVTGKAFCFTRTGFPLGMLMSQLTPKAGDPTLSLNNPKA
tara:strand:- start:3546 stop:5774 length:2229 start_codon:yes stop_codon:yes gene_type:complete